MSHPWSLQGSCLVVVDTVCNRSWLGFRRPSLELHDVLLSNGKSRDCLCRHHSRQQTTAFKINLSFAFILRNVETGELRYYHSSQNNSRFFDVPHLIRTTSVTGAPRCTAKQRKKQRLSV
jgi:hypothetical protein